MKAPQLKITGLLIAIMLAMAFAACSGPGEDRPGGVVVDPESETVSVSGTGTGTGTGTGAATGTGTGTAAGGGPATSTGTAPGATTSTGTGTGPATGTGVGPGEVEPKPAGAEQLNVSLGEWTVTPERTTVPAGQVYFLANNLGPEDPHELVIIRTNLPPDQLSVVDGRVAEDQVNLVGEIEEFAPSTQAAATFDLTPGNYALICNIAEMENGQLESHYQMGMRARLVVE
jgi:uncharacterized cupredoxin-like copper-binding protein